MYNNLLSIQDSKPKDTIANIKTGMCCVKEKLSEQKNNVSKGQGQMIDLRNALSTCIA